MESIRVFPAVASEGVSSQAGGFSQLAGVTGGDAVKKGDEARIHDVVRVNVGKYAGLAGVVEAIDGDDITVAISGAQNGEQVEIRQVFNEKALGRLKHA